MMQRNRVFDNIKGYMLFLVAFGHVVDVYCGAQKNIALYDTMKYIYLFHMPMFSFITGYFSKNLEKSRDNAVKKILIPYLVFQSVYVLLAMVMIKIGAASFNADVFNYSILLPSSAFYYLLATFFWKLFSKDMVEFRFIIPLSVILGLVISLTSCEAFHVGYGAVFSLLPFYTVGLIFKKEWIEKVRKIPHILATATMLLGVIPAIYFPYAIHSIRFTYKQQGFTNIVGIGWRVVYYLIAFIMCFAIINLAPNINGFFSKVGRKSILVYAGSTFLSPSLYVLVDKVFNISGHYILNIICMIVFCLIIIFVMSLDFIERIYLFIMNNIYKAIYKNVE